jgi:WD40 repeat protein
MDVRDLEHDLLASLLVGALAGHRKSKLSTSGSGGSSWLTQPASNETQTSKVQQTNHITNTRHPLPKLFSSTALPQNKQGQNRRKINGVLCISNALPRAEPTVCAWRGIQCKFIPHICLCHSCFFSSYSRHSNKLIELHPSTSTSQISASPDGEKIVYGSGSTVVIRDVANPSECEVYTEHKSAVSVAKYSPDGKLIASGDANGTLRVWDCVTKETKKEMPVLGGKITDLAWDGEGKRIVVGGASKGTNARVFIWNSGSAQGEVAGATKGVLSVDLRPSGPGRLLTASEDFKTRE